MKETQFGPETRANSAPDQLNQPIPEQENSPILEQEIFSLGNPLEALCKPLCLFSCGLSFPTLAEAATLLDSSFPNKTLSQKSLE